MRKIFDTPAKEMFPHGDRLKLYAKERFKTVRALSAATDIAASTFTQYFTGTQAPGYRQLQRLFNVGLSIDWLLADERELHLFQMDRAGTGQYVPCKHPSEYTNEELLAIVNDRMTDPAQTPPESHP